MVILFTFFFYLFLFLSNINYFSVSFSHFVLFYVSVVFFCCCCCCCCLFVCLFVFFGGGGGVCVWGGGGGGGGLRYSPRIPLTCTLKTKQNTQQPNNKQNTSRAYIYNRAHEYCLG